ncbi:glycosyltransferase family 2 protein [Danxiaibacter flavus]|uniref:Glycosyltransferase family 2 protein n=1 Tax=Danxiaibacter flavus TaxID=3049108 RepID=A0ABV3ZJ86_9BACT|nr:glycosyltransferase family 2 protein [Chitinophagaceae bacterium DXS]
MISVIILTKNEELDLDKCLKAVQWSNDVHVLDSGSTDSTLKIADRYAVNVSSNAFKSFGQQRNHALDNLPLINDWILFIDADEIVTDPFRIAITEAVQNANENIAGFYCCAKLMLEDTWLKRSDTFPKWQFRLMRKGKARFTDFGHGQKEYEVNGGIKYIKEPYLHYGLSKGWYKWIERHNTYSNLEAIVRLDHRPSFKHVFSKHGSIRNTALKCLLSKIPVWPAIRFMHAYFINFGFIEGIPGLLYCISNSYYEFMIQIKMREIRRARKNIAINTVKTETLTQFTNITATNNVNEVPVRMH